MKLVIGMDHRGSLIKDELINRLSAKGYEIFVSSIPNSETDDYVDFAFDVCHKMDKNSDIGILICGNGIGMSIAANKVKGIRCARVVNTDDAVKAKEHNGANVIALGENLGIDNIMAIIDTFVTTSSVTNEKHQRRVQKIINYENGAYNEL